jgi:hypothetical protein
VVIDCVPRLLRQFKADRATSLALANGRSIDRVTVRCNVIGLYNDNVAAAKLAIDRKIEERQVTYLPLHLKFRRDRQTCFGLSGGFAPVSLPLFQGPALRRK